MRRFLKTFAPLLGALAFIAALLPAPSVRADFSFTAGTGLTGFSFTAATGGTALCAAASTHCFASVPVNTAGAQLFTSAVPGVISIAAAQTLATVTTIGTVSAVTTLGNITGTVSLPTGAATAAGLTTINTTLGSPFQAGGSIGNTTFAVTNAGTFVVQNTNAAETTKVLGTVRTVGNVGGVFDAIGQNVAAPANWLQAGCQFQTTPTTITATNGSPCQMDNAGNILVSVRSATGLANPTTWVAQTGSAIMGYAQTSPTALTSGDIGFLSLVPTTRELRVAFTANSAINNAQWGGTTVVNGGTAGIVGVGGATATNVALTDNPINTGFQAISSQNAAVTTARKVQGVADLSGRQIITPYANPENWVQGTTAAMTGTTTTSLIAAPGAGLRNYVWVSCVNSHATVGTFVTIQDGSGGTALATLAAGSLYGGQTMPAPIPIRQPTTATALFVANVTTGANVICSATGYTSTL